MSPKKKKTKLPTMTSELEDSIHPCVGHGEGAELLCHIYIYICVEETWDLLKSWNCLNVSFQNESPAGRGRGKALKKRPASKQGGGPNKKGKCFFYLESCVELSRRSTLQGNVLLSGNVRNTIHINREQEIHIATSREIYACLPELHTCV